ncbi:tyrosine-protein phosphatase [Glaciimonas sp. GG7]
MSEQLIPPADANNTLDTASPDTGYVFEQVNNFRDLGGKITMDGRRIQTGRLLRSANPGLATPTDVAQLQRLHLNVVIDFRSDGEKHSAESSFAEIFNWVADPILIGNLVQSSALTALQNGTADDSREFMLAFYRDFPRHYQAPFRRFLQQAEQNHNILYHCTAGKDRTGFASLLLLSALGIERSAIVTDFLASNDSNPAGNAHLQKQVGKLGLPIAAMGPLLLVETAYLEAAQQVIDDNYGGMQQYLENTLGIDTALIRANYLESVSGL